MTLAASLLSNDFLTGQLHFNETACAVSNNNLPLVLLHGWGGDSSTFADLVANLSAKRRIISVDLPGFGNSEIWPCLDADESSIQALLDSLCAQLPAHFDLLGWSLGGMLATTLAARNQERVGHLITLATNAVFTAQQDWPAAMAGQTYEEFQRYFAQQPRQCLQQFCALEAQGDNHQRQLLKTLRRNLLTDTNSNWQSALAWLGALDNRVALTTLSIPVLHLLGAQDQLVPCAAATLLGQLNSSHQVEVLAGVAHPLHLAAEAEVVAYVERFLDDEGYQLAKLKVADSFSRAANTYDGAAILQRRVGDKLLVKLPDASQLTGGVQRVLDVGCGTGYLLPELAHKFTDAEVIGFDIAPGMLDYARQKRPFMSQWLCGDAESLPLAAQSVDVMVSNLAYQWCQYPSRWAAELQRVLCSGGIALVSTLGPDTLRELRIAWSEVDGYVHVNQFTALDELCRQVESCGLICQAVVEHQVLRYDNVNDLMRELKELGAHNINAGQSSGLTGRQRIKKLTRCYEKFRDVNGLLPASYEVIYLMISKV